MQAKGLVTQIICIIFLAHRCDHRAHLLVTVFRLPLHEYSLL